MNLPNKITLSRFLASLIFLFLLVLLGNQEDPGWSFHLISMLLFILVVSTDALDGYYARKYNLVTDFGRIADPVVDKIMVCGTFILLSNMPWCAEFLPAWLVVLIVAREFMVNGIRGFIESKGIKFGSNWAGKAKMIAQCVAIPSVFFAKLVAAALPDTPWAQQSAALFSHTVIWAALLLTLYSGYLYVSKAAEILRMRGGA